MCVCTADYELFEGKFTLHRIHYQGTYSDDLQELHRLEALAKTERNGAAGGRVLPSNGMGCTERQLKCIELQINANRINPAAVKPAYPRTPDLVLTAAVSYRWSVRRRWRSEFYHFLT